MENNNWRVAQAQSQGQAQIAGQVMGGDAAAAQGLEAGDWRSQLLPDSRQRIVNKIMDTLKRHLPFSGQEGLQELKKIAVRFEEKIYTAATSQSDYLRKISLKMLTMETKSQNPMANSIQANSASNSKNPQDPASQGMQSQMPNQTQVVPIALTSNQPQVRSPLLSQNIPNNMASTGSLNSASLASGMAPVGMSQGTMPNVSSQIPNMQDMSNAVNPNMVGNLMGSSNVFANSQRQIPTGVRQQQIAQQQEQQQQQQQSHNPQLYLYNKQAQQHLLMNQKLQQGGISQSLLQSQIQQQNLLQPNQLQPSLRQSAATSSTLQPNQQSSLQQSTQSMLQQQSQSVLRQQQQQQQQQLSMMHQQQNSMPQHQQPNTANMQQSQLIGQQNTILDAQQQQRLMAQQNNNISNLQLQQQQQQTSNVQNNLPNMHQQQSNSQQNLQQQQLGQQNNFSGFQQQQMVGVQHGNSGMQTNQQPVMLPQSKVAAQQQMQQNMANMLPNQAQQSQSQPQQQQMMSQNQSQPGQMQQQLGLQQRMQTPSSLLQQQNAIDQQRQLLQSQRMMPDVPLTSLDSSSHTGNANGGDWQEEIYQKIKSMNEKYFPDLNEMCQRMSAKLLQHDPPPQQPKNEQLEKLRFFVVMLEKLIMFLRINKNEIQPNHKEKSVAVEKQIVNILNSHRPRKPVSSLQQQQQQQGQVAQSHMHAMQQSQQAQAQLPQMHENQVNSQLQPMNIQGATSNLTNLQHNSNVINSRQNMMDQSIDHGQGNPMNSIQQVSMNSMQQNLGTGSQQLDMNSMSSSQAMQSNANALQANPNIHVKQEQQMFSTQQLKQQQYQQQRQLQQQQYIHRQPLMQQQQQSGGQMASPQQMVQQINHMNEINDIKLRQQIKSGVLQQQHSNSGQRASYFHQQMKTGTPISSISSPQLLQTASPQIGHHPSPQFDQQNMLNSHTKTGTPLQQSANSPFVVPSPSISMAPSPMPVGDSEKFNPSLSNAGNNNVQHHLNTGASIQAPSLAIGTPGISASPLLAEFTSPDGTTHGVASTIVSGNSNVVEHPLDRLIKAVKSMSPKAVSASVGDISSVVSMVDRIAGSAPGNGSRAAVGEDLVAMTKCRLQTRNFFNQDGPSGTKKMRRYTSAMPSNVVSSTGSINDGIRHLNGCESDGESTGASSIRRPKLEANYALEEELREINQRLIDTVVFISEDDVDPTAVTGATEGGEGTIVKCSYNAISLSPSLKLQYESAQMSPIQPLRLLIPSNYPNCSPILLDKFPIEVSKEYEDLNIKAKSRFSISLRTLTQPMSLGEIARTWDMCARAVISDYAQQSGGGTFSSKYGTWENCLSAA